MPQTQAERIVSAYHYLMKASYRTSPVSYTHLKLVELGLAQVYEKEVQARLLSKEITQQDLPLDVYKRQPV